MSALFADLFSIESNLQIPWDPYHTTCCELLIEKGAGYIEVALQLKKKAPCKEKLFIDSITPKKSLHQLKW